MSAALDRMTHNWQPYKNGYLHIPCTQPCFVREKPLPEGYLWQYAKQVGFSKTLEEAKAWAETAREIWPRHLPKG